MCALLQDIFVISHSLRATHSLDIFLLQIIVCTVAGHLRYQSLTIWHGDRQEQVRGAQQAAD